MIVSLEGCIGSGKSTTTRLLGERMGLTTLLGQPLSSMFLEEFYSDPDLTALETELGFLLVHYHQLRSLGADAQLIADFAPGRDMIFAHLNLGGEDLAVFEDLYSSLISRVQQPALTVYLRVPTDELLRRIQNRGRLYELKMTVDYLESLNALYDENIALLGPNVQSVNVLPGETEHQVAEKVRQVISASGVLK